MKLGSLFSGSGGFELGGLISGIVPVWASEIEPFPIRVTSKRFPKIKHLGDISKVKGNEIEPVDVITFGSPCQDLSVAGKRAGLKHTSIGNEETTRSGLFMEAIRIIKEMRCKTNGEYPTFAVWENVPGAYSSNKGEDFRAVLEELCKIKEESVFIPKPTKWLYAGEILGDGYSIAWRTLDAQYWGVPQRRRRIYLVADFRGERASKVLFERKGLRGDIAPCRTQGQGITADAKCGTGTADISIPYTLKIRVDIKSTGIIDNIGGQAEYAYNSEVNGTLRAGAQGAVFYAVENHPADSRVNIDDSGKCQTLTSRMGTGGGNVPMVMEQQQGFIDVETEVAVRKYEVDKDKLVSVLREHKGNRTNKEIAETLGKPLTLVEHWFRNDKSFSIPDPDVWFDLKELLGITTTEFDQSITEFEFKGGNYDMGNRIYVGDTAPTLTCGCGNYLHLLSEEPVICLQGNGIDRADTAGCNGKGWKEDTSYTLNTIDRPAICYSIDRAAFNQGINAQYDIGIDDSGRAHTLVARGPSAVAYDVECLEVFHCNAEKNKTQPLKARDYKDPLVVSMPEVQLANGKETTGCLMASGYEKLGAQEMFSGDYTVIENRAPQYIVRRLTPLECCRLQGFPDWWCDGLETPEPTEEDLIFWREVFETHRKIVTGATKPKTDKQIIKWLKDPHSDSAEYKLWGNGVALPNTAYVLQGIADELYRM